MKTEIKELTNLNSHLEAAMKHLLEHLREILASIHEERIAHGQGRGRNENGHLKEVLQKREELISSFNQSYLDFMYFLKQLTDELGTDFSLSEGLEWLQIHLDVENVELLLISEQLMSLGEEIQVETKNLINFLENKSGLDSALIPQLIKQPKPLRLLVGFADDEFVDE